MQDTRFCYSTLHKLDFLIRVNTFLLPLLDAEAVFFSYFGVSFYLKYFTNEEINYTAVFC